MIMMFSGEALAEILMERVQGKRPVTLVGYSLGARVIFYALEALAQLGRWAVLLLLVKSAFLVHRDRL